MGGGLGDHIDGGQQDPQKPDTIVSGGLGDNLHVLDSIPKGNVPMGRLSNTRIQDYSGYLTHGVNSDFNLDLKRAQNQSGWQQFGLFLGNLIPNVAGSLIEGVGYLGSLATEWGDDRDYNNAMTELGKAIRNPLGEIYREHPNEAWNPSDPAWWYQNTESLLESATAFAAEGVGIAKIFATIPKAIRAIGAGAELVKGARGLAQLGTAATLAYTEGAQQGAQVYDETYKYQLQKGIDDGIEYREAQKRANKIASNVAAGSVQLNTLFATALNLTALAPLFKDSDEIRTWFKNTAKNSESYDSWKNKIMSAGAGDKDIAKLLNPRNTILASYLSEAGQEGVEELINNWSQQRGFDRGKKGEKYKGLGDMLSDLDSFFDDTMNAQGGLSFAMGAIGGIAQTVTLDHIPMHTLYQDAMGNYSTRQFDSEVTPDGKYTKKLVSSHFKNVVGGRNYFENIKDKLVEDIKSIDDLNGELAKAIEDKNEIKVRQIKMKLFNASALNAVQLGIGQPFSKQYENIAALDNTKSLSQELEPRLEELDKAIEAEQDPAAKAELEKERDQMDEQYDQLLGVTEAMKKGFAKSPEDNTYKTKAQKAIQDIKDYTKLWEELQRKHNTGEEWDSHYADYLFGKQVESKTRTDIIKEVENRLAELEAKKSLTFNKAEDALVNTSVSDITSNNAARESLIKDIKAANRAWIDVNSEDGTKVSQAYDTLKELASVYSPNAESEEDLVGSTHQIVDKIKGRIDSIDNEINQSLTNLTTSPGYTEWSQKNPNKQVIDYVKSVRQSAQEDMALEKEKAELRQFKEETAISDSNLKDLQTSKGRNQYIKKAKSTRNKLLQTINSNIQVSNVDTIEKLTESQSSSNLDELQHNQYKDSLIRQQEANNKEIEELNKKKEELTQQLEQINSKGLVQRAINSIQVLNLKSQLERVNGRLAILNNKNNQIAEQIQNIVLPEPLFSAPVQQTSTSYKVENVVAPVINTIKDEIAAMPVMDEANAIKVASDSTWDLLEDDDHPITQLPEAEQATYRSQLESTVIKPLLEEYNKIKPEEPDPLQTVVNLINQTKTPQKRKASILADLAGYYEEVKGGQPFSLGFLQTQGHVGKGKLSKANSLIIMNEFGKLLGQNVQPNVQVQPVPTQQKSESGQEISTDDIPLDEAPDSTEGQPAELDISTYTSLGLEVIAHDGLKVRDTSKVNTLTHEYEQDIEKGEDGNYYVNKNTFFLNDGVNPRYLQPGYLKKGDAVILQIDEDWKGTTNDTKNFMYGVPNQVNDEFADYIAGGARTGAPKIGDSDNTIGNVPIKIVDPRSSTILGYLPRIDWILAQYPNVTDDYRNVVNIIYDKEGDVIEDKNVQKEAGKILLLRKKLVDGYNNGHKEGVKTAVSNRNTGHALRVTPGLASELLPDTSLKLGLYGKSSVKTGPRTTDEVEVDLPSYLSGKNAKHPYKNVPGILVPDSSGRMNFEPLWSLKLGKAEIDTAIRAIEIYLTIGDSRVSEQAREKAEDDAKEILKATGFDLRQSADLSSFINQFYYFTKSYSDQQMLANTAVLKGQAKVPEFKLSIAKQTGTGYNKAIVKAGVTFMNINIGAQVDENGSLNANFKQLMFDQNMGLASKFRNVIFRDSTQKLTGINTPGKLTEMVYQPVSGTFRKVEHASYNDMIKANSMTSLYGKLQMQNGTYVYYANPTTHIDYQEALSQEILALIQPSVTDISTVKDEISKPDTETDKTREAYLKRLQADEDDISASSVRQVLPGAGKVLGKEVTLANLTDLRNFTPVENRNNRSPIEVFEELSKLGLVTLPEGQNPFYTC